MAETDPAVVGVQSCGCVTYADSRPDDMDRTSERVLAKIVREGGQILRTTVGEARAMPNFLPRECPHDPKGWERERPRKKEPHERLRYKRMESRHLSIVSVVIEPHTVAGTSSWPKGIRGGEVGKRSGQWYATPGWLDSYKAEAWDGKHPRGPAEVLGPFSTQREAALALIPYAEANAAECAASISEARSKREPVAAGASTPTSKEQGT